MSDASSKKSVRPEGREPAVRLSNVTKRFGAKTAVDGVTLSIAAGSVFGLIGPNGAGKTTTFSMLAGFLAPSEGSVEMLGYRATDVGALKGRVGVLPQDALLPASDTVGEFLMHMAWLQEIPAEKWESSVHAVLEEVAGKEWYHQRCGSLSHGMAKRVQLAQALLGDPEIVLLDEPTAGLDPKVAYEVREIIARRKGRCTLIVSSHNLHELEQLCDAAAVLDFGKLVANSSIAELTSASEEIHVKLASASAPLAQIRELPMVSLVTFDDETKELTVRFDRQKADAETTIGHVLSILLHAQARISGVSKGKGLEKRVMELT